MLTSEKRSPVFCGFTDYGSNVSHVKNIFHNDTDTALANKVIQFMFNGLAGWKFPICHYPIVGIEMREMRMMIDEIIVALNSYGFEV